MPVGRAAFAGEVEQVPQRLDGADVAGFLPGIDGCVEEFRAPEVADRADPELAVSRPVGLDLLDHCATNKNDHDARPGRRRGAAAEENRREPKPLAARVVCVP